MPLPPTIQRGAFKQTPGREERQQQQQQQPQQMDLTGLFGLMQQAAQQNIQAARQPVGQIAESSRNRPRYDIMNDPNYRPGINPQYGRIGEDVPSPNNVPREMQAPAPAQSQPTSPGQGFQGMLPGGVPWSADQPVGTLSAAPQPERPAFPGGINPLTGMAPNTLPGDAGYVAQTSSQQIQTQRDPQVQNVMDLSGLVRGFRQDNAGFQGTVAPPRTPVVGGSEVPQYGNVPRAQYGTDGKLISSPYKLMQTQSQIPDVSRTSEGFDAPENPPINQNSYDGRLNVTFGEMPFNDKTSPAEKYTRLMRQGYTSSQAAALAGLKGKKTTGTFEGTGFGALMNAINKY